MPNPRRILWAANLALLALLGYMLAGLVLGREDEDATGTPADAAPGPTAARAEPPVTQSDCTFIIRRNIFASSRSASAALAEAAAHRPPARTEQPLQLRLLGTVAGDPDIARAVIEDLTSRAQDLYKIGDTVQGARIEAIERESVVLARGDRTEVLELHMTSRAEAGARTAERPAAPSVPEVHEAVSALSANRFHVNKSALLARVGGIEAVLKAGQLSPYTVDGQMKGVRLNGLDGISMAKFIGLENDDVIQTVNGQELNSMTKAFQVLQKARAQSSLQVQLLRGEETKILSFSME